MSLKNLNAALGMQAPSKDWTPDKRFIPYVYAPFKFPTHTLPQDQSRVTSREAGAALKSLVKPVQRER
jgi:hypothetical protein